MDQDRISPEEAADRAMLTIEAETIGTAQVDEIQISRRAPKLTGEIERMIAVNPSLGRAWSRMEKNYQDAPYQEESPKETASIFAQALISVKAAVERNNQESGVPTQTRAPLQTGWIYGEKGKEGDKGLANVEDAVEISPSLKPTIPKQPENMFLTFAPSDRGLTIELAWTVTNSQGSKTHARIVELTIGAPDTLETLRAFRAQVQGKRVNMWDIQGFYSAMNPFLDPHKDEFEPLHEWLSTTGVRNLACNVYAVDNADITRVSVKTLARRFTLSEQPWQKAKSASLLLRIRDLMDRDICNRHSGNAVEPLALDDA